MTGEGREVLAYLNGAAVEIIRKVCKCGHRSGRPDESSMTIKITIQENGELLDRQ